MREGEEAKRGLPLSSTTDSFLGPTWRQQQLVVVDDYGWQLPHFDLLAMLSEKPLLSHQNFTDVGGVTCFAYGLWIGWDAGRYPYFVFPFVRSSNVHVGMDLSTTWYDYGFDRPQAPIQVSRFCESETASSYT